MMMINIQYYEIKFFFIRFIYLFIATAASRKLTKSLLISIADPVQTENTDCKCAYFRCIYQSCTEIKKMKRMKRTPPSFRS